MKASMQDEWMDGWNDMRDLPVFLLLFRKEERKGGRKKNFS